MLTFLSITLIGAKSCEKMGDFSLDSEPWCVEEVHEVQDTTARGVEKGSMCWMVVNGGEGYYGFKIFLKRVK